MLKKVEENNFKFSLYLGDDVINETIFSADVFNPVIRYSVDIRNNIPLIINRLQKVLSSKNLNYTIYFNKKSYNFLNYYRKILKSYKNYIDNKLIMPEIKTVKINDRVISGVEFKFCFHINDNLIVERVFYVERYNPLSRFSIELSSVINNISNEIYNFLKKSDIDHMWDDYDLIHFYGLHINQIRELPKTKRIRLLDDLNNKKLAYSN